MSDWRTRAQPVTQPVNLQGAVEKDYLTQFVEAQDNAQPAATAPQSDWRTRAQAVTQPAPVQPSVGMDVAKSLTSGLAKGAVDATMILPNVLNEAVAGPQYLYQGIKDTFQGNPTNKDFQPYKPFFSSADVTSGSMIDYQPKTTAGTVTNIAAQLGSNIASPTLINKAGNSVMTNPKVQEFVNSPASKALPLTGPKPEPLKTSEDLAKMSGEAFKQASELGSTYRPQDVSVPFSKSLAAIRPKPMANGKVTSEEQKLLTHLTEYDGLAGQNLSFDAVMRLDQGLTQKINANFIDARTGQPDNNGRLLMKLQTDLRNQLDNVPENAANDALRNANKLWKAKIILNDLDTVAERASMTQNTAQSLRTGYKNLYMDKDRIRAWPQEAKDLLKKAATPGITDDVLIPLGSRMASIIGLGTGDLTGAATSQVVGMAARGGRTRVAAKQGAKVQQSVVDSTLGGLREVKVPKKSNIPLMLAAPSKMSPAPMTDKQVNIARKQMTQPKPIGADTSGAAIAPAPTRLLAAPENMTPLPETPTPMTDTQVNIAQKLGAKASVTGADTSGVAIAPPVTRLLQSPKNIRKIPEPMTDTQGNIAQKLGSVTPPKGADTSGVALKTSKNRKISKPKISKLEITPTENLKFEEPKIGKDKVTLYHVTDTDAASRILKEGFKPVGKSNFQGYKSALEGTYGWSTKAQADVNINQMGELGDINDFVIMKIEVPLSKFASRLKGDEDVVGTNFNNWKKSYKEGSAVVEGELPPEYITEIFTNKKLGD